MTAAVTELHPFFLPMDWKRFIVKNSATAVENDSTTAYSFVKPQLLGEPATAEQALLAAPAGLHALHGERFERVSEFIIRPPRAQVKYEKRIYSN